MVSGQRPPSTELSLSKIPYSGKLLSEKTFANFAVLWLFRKVFSKKFGSVVSFGTAKVSNLEYFSPICESFLPQKFPAVQYIVSKYGKTEQSAQKFT